MTIEGLLTDIECEKLIADRLGRDGGARYAYLVNDHPEVVIKKVHLSTTGPNFFEWFIWQAVKNTQLRELFGQCHGISETGRYLVMERLDDLAPADYPIAPNVPDWVLEARQNAFGKNNKGQIKLRDYASVDLTELFKCTTLEPKPWQVSARGTR